MVVSKLALNAVESENLFSMSMGKMEDSTRRWSKAMAEAFKLNEFSVRKNVGVFNVMLKSMGATETNAQTMAQQMTDLAFNMSSFYDLSHEEAFGKIRSGLVGLTKPLQNIGIITKVSVLEDYVATNKEFAASIGYTTGQLTELQKVYTRFVVIQDQTKIAADDLARTMNEGTNIFRGIKDKAMELGVALGKVILPALQKVGLAIREGLINNQSKIVYVFEKLVEGISAAIPFLKEFGGRVIANLVLNMGGLIEAFQSLMDPTDEAKEKFYDIINVVESVAFVFIEFWTVILKGILFIGEMVNSLATFAEWLGFTEGMAIKLGTAFTTTILLGLYFSKTIWAIGIAVKDLAIAIGTRLIPLIVSWWFNFTILIGVHGLLGATMAVVKLTAITMWTAIGGPVGAIILGIIGVGVSLAIMAHKMSESKKEAEAMNKEMELTALMGKVQKFEVAGDEKGKRRIKEIEAQRKLMGENAAKREVAFNRQKKLLADNTAKNDSKILKDKLAEEKKANKERLREYKKSLKKLRDAQKEIVTMSVGDVSFQTSRRVIKQATGTAGAVARQEADLVAAIVRVESAIKNEGQKTRQDNNNTH